MVKNYISIKDSEKQIYRVFKELEKHGRSVVECNDKYKQQSIARSLGKRTSEFVDRNLIYPIGSPRQKRMNLIQIPFNVKIVEKKKGNISRFFFKIKKKQ